MMTPAQKEWKRQQRIAVKEGHQKLLTEQLLLNNLPHPLFEYQFHAKRKWQIDFAWPEYQIALEVEGIYSKGGGHRSISVFEANMEKYNEMAIEGWKLIRVTPDMLEHKDGRAIALLKRMLSRLPDHKQVHKTWLE